MKLAREASFTQCLHDEASLTSWLVKLAREASLSSQLVELASSCKRRINVN